MDINLLKIVFLKSQTHIIFFLFITVLMLCNIFSNAQNVTITIGHHYTHQDTDNEIVALNAITDTIHTTKNIPAYENKQYQQEKTIQPIVDHSEIELDQEEKQGLFQRLFKKRGFSKRLFVVLQVISAISFMQLYRY